VIKKSIAQGVTCRLHKCEAQITVQGNLKLELQTMHDIIIQFEYEIEVTSCQKRGMA
jgi:hypothetical protein